MESAEQGGVRPSREKKDRLRELEGFIRGYKLAWRHGGEALREVLESDLYMLFAPTFEQYCFQRWQLSRRHAQNLIAGAKVAQNLRGKKQGETWPDQVKHQLTLRAALALAKLPDDLQPKCLREVIAATGTESPSAKQVAETAEKWLPLKAGKRPKKKVKPKPWRQRFAGGEILVRLKVGVDLRALLLEAIARIDASKVA
jgi:hypothetical protein